MRSGERLANFELLRIVAMFMIISLHYLVKGGVVSAISECDTDVNILAGILEAFCIVAVNCYVLISGYFCLESEWKPGRIVSLLGQVLFYSVLVTVAGIVTGAVSVAELSVYDWARYLLPVSTEHYWFVTAYLFMYLFAPILGRGLSQLREKQLREIMIALVFFFSVIKTVVPISFVTDRFGYDFGWFLCLFVVAAYIRRFGFRPLEKTANAASLYVVMCLVVFGVSFVAGRLSDRIQAFAYYKNMPYCYNYFPVLVASVSLFYIFKNWNLNHTEGVRAVIIRCIEKVAPLTFGVYLLHEHELLRYEWMKWLGVNKVATSVLFVPHMLACVLIVFVVGCLVDFIRLKLVMVLRRICACSKE